MPRLHYLALGALLSACGGATMSDPPDASDASYEVSFADRSVPDDAAVPAPDVAPVPDAGADVVPDARRGPPYPIVLQHGFAGWGSVGPVNYFYNVAQDLRARGEVVYESVVAPFNSSDVRGPQLAANVDRALAETGAERIVLIAHSQGGLDGRYLISHLGYGDRVALLVTVATPHRGTRIADAFNLAVPGVTDGLLNAFATLLGVSYNQVQSNADLRASLVALSQDNSNAFNNANPNDPRVAYWSWAGRSNLRAGIQECAGGHYANNPLQLDSTVALLAPIGTYIEQGDPVNHVNDGLVEVSSARWGLFQGCVPADHFDEIGQIAQPGTTLAGFNHIDFYRTIVAQARAAGY